MEQNNFDPYSVQSIQSSINLHVISLQNYIKSHINIAFLNNLKWKVISYKVKINDITSNSISISSTSFSSLRYVATLFDFVVGDKAPE